jgi:hypothetical protein
MQTPVSTFHTVLLAVALEGLVYQAQSGFVFGRVCTPVALLARGFPQREMEREGARRGGGALIAPVQRVDDFMAGAGAGRCRVGVLFLAWTRARPILSRRRGRWSSCLEQEPCGAAKFTVSFLLQDLASHRCETAP